MKMLNGLNKRVDVTQKKIERMDDRLKSMIAKRSNKFYYLIIAIEIAAILLIMFLF
jgi:hypothetical protein